MGRNLNFLNVHKNTVTINSRISQKKQKKTLKSVRGDWILSSPIKDEMVRKYFDKHINVRKLGL